MASGITLTVPAIVKDPEKFRERLIEELHSASDELGQMEAFNVSMRTPVRTSALLSGISYVPGFDASSDVLAYIYADTDTQMEEYKRVYDLYQEGGSLGLATYTNKPHEMFGKMFTDDISAIEAWGMECVNRVLIEMAIEEKLEESE